MTADKVTLRLNAVVTYRIVDAQKTVSAADDVRQALYREAQTGAAAVIGGRNWMRFWPTRTRSPGDRAGVARRAGELGLEIASVGIRT